VLIDSTHLKAHRSAAGGKRGVHTSDRRQLRRTQHKGPRPHRPLGMATRHPADARPSCRLQSGRAAVGRAAAAVHRSYRPRLRPQPHRDLIEGQMLSRTSRQRPTGSRRAASAAPFTRTAKRSNARSVASRTAAASLTATTGSQQLPR
jgi:hypothetical protein